MTKQSNMPHQTMIELSHKTMIYAIQRAKSLGRSLSEYIESVLIDKFKDPWKEPLPDKVVEMYKRDYEELLEEGSKHPKKPIYTAEELIMRLHEEIEKEKSALSTPIRSYVIIKNV